jgi:hypothetical protein
MLTKAPEVEVMPPLRAASAIQHRASRNPRLLQARARAGPDDQAFARPRFFARAFLEFGAPTWPNGFDMSPEWLRRKMLAAGELSASAA